MKFPAFFLFVFFGFSLSAKGDVDKIKSTDVDSLQTRSSRELAIMFWRGKNLDSLYKLKLANTYISKVKKGGDLIKIADGYQMFMYMYKRQFKVYLQYADSIITITKDLKNHHYPATGHIFKGGVLRDMERYTEALESLLKAKKLAEKNNFETQIIDAEDIIAELKTILGKDEEALEIYKKHFSILSKNKSVEKNSQNYISSAYLLADSFNRNKEYDSAHFYVNIGIKSSLASFYRFFYPELILTSGINNYHRDNYKLAIDSLHKTIRLLGNNEDDIKVRTSYLYLAKSYKQLKNHVKAIEYLEKVDLITDLSNYRLEIREAFELLKEYYSQKKDRKKLIRLLEKWIQYEKFRQEKYKKLDKEIVEKYDIPKLIKENEMLFAQTLKNNKMSKFKLIFIGGLLILCITLLYLFFYRWKKGKLEVALDEQFEKVKMLEVNKKKSANTPNQEFSEVLRKEILGKLEVFEQNKLYLKNDLTLVKVSKKLKTNSTYLSKVINVEKKKNFTQYINDLRIEYCVEEIDNNRTFRQYSVSSMANEVGFNNIQSFAKAFSKKKGCNPAEYIKNL